MEKPLTDHPSDIPTVEKPDFDCPESDRGRWINRLLPGGIRERLFLLITLALTPLLVLVGWIFYQRYHIRHAQALQTEVEVARGIATTFAAYIEGVQERNLAIGQAFITNPSYSAADASHFLTHTAALLPIVRSVSWISPQGIVTASSLPEAVGLDLSGRGYFQAVLAGQDWMLDDLLLSSATPDTPIVAVANGIRDEQGTLHGVMLTTLHPARLGALVFTQPRPASGAYAIFDRRGVLAYSSQDGDLTWEERRARQANDQLLQQVLATGEEQVDIVELEVPGGRWVTAQVPIAGLGWVAGARRPVAVAIDPVERALVLDGLLALFVGLLGFGTAAFLGQTISRPLHRLEEDAERMGTGVLESQPDPMAPTEVRHLRCTVENMASALLLRAEALQRSRMLLAGAEQLSHTGAWEWDLTTNQWMFSDEWLAIHGCQKSTLTPDELLQISHPDDRQEARQAFEAVRAGLRPYDLEHRILRQDTGEVRMVRVHGQFEKNPAGEIVRVYGFAQDVTERKRAEDEALEALAHLEVQRRLTEQREKERM
jgi:PAS domain S-box-containing protein